MPSSGEDRVLTPSASTTGQRAGGAAGGELEDLDRVAGVVGAEQGGVEDVDVIDVGAVGGRGNTLVAQQVVERVGLSQGVVAGVERAEVAAVVGGRVAEAGERRADGPGDVLAGGRGGAISENVRVTLWAAAEAARPAMARRVMLFTGKLLSNKCLISPGRPSPTLLCLAAGGMVLRPAGCHNLKVGIFPKFVGTPTDSGSVRTPAGRDRDVPKPRPPGQGTRAVRDSVVDRRRISGDGGSRPGRPGRAAPWRRGPGRC
jgi:hypothetical protein